MKTYEILMDKSEPFRMEAESLQTTSIGDFALLGPKSYTEEGDFPSVIGLFSKVYTQYIREISDGREYS